MSVIPDAPRRKAEPMKGFKNGCLAALFWAVIAAVLIGLIAYAMMIWVAEEATEPQPQQPPPVAIEG